MDRNILYYERQALPRWAAIVVGATVAVCFATVVIAVLTSPHPVPPDIYAVLAVPLLVTGLVANLFFMHTEVTIDALTVRFGWWLTVYRRRVAMSDITRAQAVTYSPLAEYGGWGIRGYPGDQVLNARGNQGVRLFLRNRDRLLIGSQTPDALVAALQNARFD